jgi:hypothetical protein
MGKISQAGNSGIRGDGFAKGGCEGNVAMESVVVTDEVAPLAKLAGYFAFSNALRFDFSSIYINYFRALKE